MGKHKKKKEIQLYIYEAEKEKNQLSEEYMINLYLEQIKYLRQENIEIQNHFLSGSSVPVAALGLLIYYIESVKTPEVQSLYLFLPFFYFSGPYNLVKYTTRMLGINGYIKKLEEKINTRTGNKAFLWNSELINTGCFRGGFAAITTLVQLPIHVIVSLYLLERFFYILKVDTIFEKFHGILGGALVIEIIGLLLMLIDTALVRKKVMEKVDSES